MIVTGSPVVSTTVKRRLMSCKSRLVETRMRTRPFGENGSISSTSNFILSSCCPTRVKQHTDHCLVTNGVQGNKPNSLLTNRPISGDHSLLTRCEGSSERKFKRKEPRAKALSIFLLCWTASQNPERLRYDAPHTTFSGENPQKTIFYMSDDADDDIGAGGEDCAQGPTEFIPPPLSSMHSRSSSMSESLSSASSSSCSSSSSPLLALRRENWWEEELSLISFHCKPAHRVSHHVCCGEEEERFLQCIAEHGMFAFDINQRPRMTLVKLYTTGLYAPRNTPAIPNTLVVSKRYVVCKAKLRSCRAWYGPFPYDSQHEMRRRFPPSWELQQQLMKSTAEMNAKRVLVDQAWQMLNALVVDWIGEVSRKSAVFISGSTALGMYELDCDVDFVCLVPACVQSRGSFFTTFADMLGHYSEHFTLVRTVSESQVPLLQLVFCGKLRIDLLLAITSHVHEDEGEEDDVLSEALMEGMDPTSVRSWSGPRNAEMLLWLIPKRMAGLGIYASTLHIVRIWAKARGIYSSKLGFLGGLSWSILVCFISQLFPACESEVELLYWFFEVLSKWDWTAHAIRLCECDAGNAEPIINSTDAMRILTPAIPITNSSYTVTRSTLQVISNELTRADQVFRAWLRDSTNPQALLALIHPVSLREDAQGGHVIKLVLKATNRLAFDNLFPRFESKLSKFTKLLEHVPNVHEIRPFPQPSVNDNKQAVFYFSLSCKQGKRVEFDYTAVRGMFDYFCSMNGFSQYNAEAMLKLEVNGVEEE